MLKARIQELASQVYGTVPEIPAVVHAERRELAQVVLRLGYAPVGIIKLEPPMRAGKVTVITDFIKVPAPAKPKKEPKPEPPPRPRAARPGRDCLHPGCTAAPKYRIGCKVHLQALPATVKSVLFSRPEGQVGKPPAVWSDARARAVKLLSKGGLGG